MDPIGAITGGAPFDAQLQMSSNGAGGIGTVSVNAYIASASAYTTPISGVKYSVSNSAFVLSFPTNSSTALVQGAVYLYSTADGSFVFGGAPNNVDMIVGVRNGSSGGNFGGLYYQAGMDEDLTNSSFDTYYGSFNANSTALLGHQRVLFFGSNAFGFTYADYSALSSNATYNDSFTVENYTGGNGGAVRIGYGIGLSLGISVAVQAPSFSGGGVYLNPTGVLNSASSAPFTAGVSRGELITLVGNNIGPSQLQVAQSVPFPTKLGGVQVLVNNIAAPIYYVSAGQVAALVPYETASSVAQIQVSNNGTLSNAVTEPVNLTTPGIFTEPAGGAGYAAALHPDFSLVSPNSPAQIGETIAVYVTGLGDVFPSIPDGSVASSTSFSNTSNQITATVGGIAATVTFAGLAPGLAGLYQVNVTIPSGVTAGDNYLELLGPDSDALEALVTISSSGLGVQAKDTRPEALHRRNPGAHLLPRVRCSRFLGNPTISPRACECRPQVRLPPPYNGCSRFGARERGQPFGMTDLKKKLEEEIAALDMELRVELPREIAKARAHGDLSENAEYHAAKERQGMVNARLGQLRQRLRELSMIDFSRIPRDRAGLGSSVTVFDLQKDEEVVYKLVTSEDANVAEGRISTTSPIGRALLGKQVGDTVKVQIPGGTREMEIVKLLTIHEAQD